MSYHKVPVTLSRPQALKLLKGGAVQLNSEQLNGQQHYLALHPSVAKKVQSARRKNRGVRVSLSPEELEMSGSGLKDFFQSLGSKAKKVIQSPEYQKFVKPIVKKLVDTGLQQANVYLPDSLEKYAKRGVDLVGEKTGAYGFREEVAKGKKLYEKYAKQHVAPHLRKAATIAAKKGVEYAKKKAPKYSAEIEQASEKYLESGVERLGKETGAYGVVAPRSKKLSVPKDYNKYVKQEPLKKRSSYALNSSQQQLLSPNHPAMWENRELPAPGDNLVVHYHFYGEGSGFKPAGYGVGGSFMPA